MTARTARIPQRFETAGNTHDRCDRIVYLNGKFLPLGEAQVSVLDRGFIYGDGVYELVPVYGREPFRLPHHLARLQRSLDGIGLANPHTNAQWEALIRELVARQPFDDQGVYFQVTRGAAKRDHSFPARACRRRYS